MSHNPSSGPGFVTVGQDLRLPAGVQNKITESVIADPRLTEVVGPAVVSYIAENPLQGATVEYVENVIQAHREEASPHTAYDDMESLVLIFENKLI